MSEMNAKIFGSFMIVGPLLAVLMWSMFVPEIGDLSVSEGLDKLMENDVAVRYGTLAGAVGFLVMLLGLFISVTYTARWQFRSCHLC